ncbi:hypothetical protein FHR71_005596 [Methylobacterium sp. RAS18]|nr:hypothetical protein [Methylobacterium sp. RAS18]
MLTVGMATALALVGGHMALARAIWPGERVEDAGPAPDPLLKARADAAEMVAGIRARRLAETEGALAAAQKAGAVLRAELDGTQATARSEIKALLDERTILRRELARMRRTEVLAAAEDEDGEVKDDDGDEEDGSGSASPAPRPGPRH